MLHDDVPNVQEHCCLFVMMKLAQSKLCRPCFSSKSNIRKIVSEQTNLKKEFRVDKILKKLNTLEGIVKESVLPKDQLDWHDAYIKFSLFKA